MSCHLLPSEEGSMAEGKGHELCNHRPSGSCRHSPGCTQVWLLLLEPISFVNLARLLRLPKPRLLYLQSWNYSSNFIGLSWAWDQLPTFCILDKVDAYMLVHLPLCPLARRWPWETRGKWEIIERWGRGPFPPYLFYLLFLGKKNTLWKFISKFDSLQMCEQW